MIGRLEVTISVVPFSTLILSSKSRGEALKTWVWLIRHIGCQSTQESSLFGRGPFSISSIHYFWQGIIQKIVCCLWESAMFRGFEASRKVPMSLVDQARNPPWHIPIPNALFQPVFFWRSIHTLGFPAHNADFKDVQEVLWTTAIEKWQWDNTFTYRLIWIPDWSRG